MGSIVPHSLPQPPALDRLNPSGTSERPGLLRFVYEITSERRLIMKGTTNCNPTVKIARFQPNREDPAPAMRERICAISPSHSGCLYLNPLATVSCEIPTPEFFRVARKLQGLWCQRCQTTYGRKARRSVKDWVNCDGFPQREERYLDRTLCFIGMLIIDGKFVPPHQWPDRKAKTSKSIKARKRPKERIASASINDSMPEDVRKVS